MIMKKKTLLIAFVAMFACLQSFADDRTLTLYKDVVFYDGYNSTVFDADLKDGILRHRNSLYAIRLTDDQLDWAGNRLTMNVTIGALCDNYDRIGNINIALTEKGVTTYDPFAVPRLELGRFITPFMNKNKTPTEVPYTYELNNLPYILHDQTLREKYDLWLEFELFGVPYAAQEQVAGCKGHNDVFLGTLEWVTSANPIENTTENVLVPIVMKKPEYIASNLNNYNEQGTDTIGKCTKTWKFTVPRNVVDGNITLITSNHGANYDGEEYNRRLHLVYYDDQLVMTYIPGGVSCEPYRQYNTQGNGIYGWYPMSDSEWASFSNWCPGAVIPIRTLELGAVEEGEHRIMIRVPDAVFNEQQGDIPVSMYFQGFEHESPITKINTVKPQEIQGAIKMERVGSILKFQSESVIDELQIVSVEGKMVDHIKGNITDYDMTNLAKGTYVVATFTADGSHVAFIVNWAR